MLITTEAIVISALKYGDTSLIVKCLTASDGMKSYLLKGVLAARKSPVKAAYFQPLTQLDIVARHSNKSTLHYIREVKINYPYTTLSTCPGKNAVTLFISEILSYTLYEEEENTALFQYIKEALQWLDTHEEIANFPLLFLLNLTAYLGFYPNTQYSAYPFFDLQEGKFVPAPTLNPYITGKNIVALKTLLGTKFDNLSKTKIKKEDRQKLLHVLMEYFQLHIHGFRKPKSLSVLREVFN